MKIAGAIILLGVSLLWAGCGEARSPEPVPAPGPFDDLAALGSTLTWAGGICAAGGIALRVIALFYPPLAGIAWLFGLAATGGIAVTVTGAACSWLAANPILVLLVAAACGLAVAWWHWPGIRRALDRRLEGKP